MDRLNDAVRRVLETKCYLNLWDTPVPGANLASTVYSDSHRALAREAVRKSLVLLVNQKSTLPVKPNTFDTLVVAGKAADNTGY